MLYELSKNKHTVSFDMPAVWIQTMHGLMKKDLDREALANMIK